MLVISYVFVLGLIPLLVEKNDKEVQWHAKNGLVLFGAWVLFFMIDAFLLGPFLFLGCLYSVVMAAVNLLYLILMVIAIVRAVNGRRLVIPYLSSLADKF
jgi:uncharacterized membrane protein